MTVKKFSDAMMTATVETQTKMQTPKMQKLVRIGSMVALAFCMMLSCAFAAPTTGTADAIQNGVNDGAKQLYGVMTAILLPVAAVVFAWAAFKVLFGGEKGMEQAKKTILTIVIVLALVYLAPLIINQVGGWFSSSGGWLW